MSEHRDDRGFVEHWRRFGPILEKIREEELQNLTPEKRLGLIDALLAMPVQAKLLTTTSGLVEMQRLFAKARK